MAIIRVLATLFKADTRQFEGGVKKARRATNDWRRGVQNINRSLGRMRNTVLLAAGAFGIQRFVRNQFAAVDVLAKTADKIGINIQALRELRHAGEITGVSQSELDKALERFSRSIGEASRGTGEAVPLFRSLGLRAEELAELPLDVALDKFADRFQKLRTESAKTDAAAKIFGRSGVALVNTLNLGSSGIGKLRTEFRTLGGVMDREGAAKVEAANDALSKLKVTITSFGEISAQKLAPGLRDFFEGLGFFIRTGTTDPEKMAEEILKLRGNEAFRRRVGSGVPRGMGRGPPRIEQPFIGPPSKAPPPDRGPIVPLHPLFRDPEDERTPSSPTRGRRIRDLTLAQLGRGAGEFEIDFLDTSKRKVDRLGNALKAVNREWSGFSHAAFDVGSFQLGAGLWDGMTDKARDFRDVIRDITNDLGRMFVTFAVRSLFQAGFAAAGIPGFAAQHGFDGMVRRPTMFLAGEAGPEHVKVTPGAAPGSSGPVNITVFVGGRRSLAQELESPEARDAVSRLLRVLSMTRPG